jgi:hypothetical protein
MMLETQAVMLRRDAADGAAVALGDEERDIGMEEIGVLLRIDMLGALEEERRDPIRIIGEDTEWNPEERLAIGGARNLTH